MLWPYLPGDAQTVVGARGNSDFCWTDSAVGAGLVLVESPQSSQHPLGGGSRTEGGARSAPGGEGTGGSTLQPPEAELTFLLD